MTKREIILDLRKDQKVGNYTIVSIDNTPDSSIVKPLGEEVGLVSFFLAERSFTSKVSIKRAIKFFIYRDDIIPDKKKKIVV